MSGRFNLFVARTLLWTGAFSLAAVAITACVASVFIARFWVFNALREPPPIVRQTVERCEQGAFPIGALDLQTRAFEFYDPKTLRNVREGGRALPDKLAQDLASGRKRSLQLGLPFGAGTAGAYVMSEASPCGVAAVWINYAPIARPSVFPIVLLLALGVSLSSMLGAHIFAVRPMLRRVAETQAAAERIGTAHFAPPPAGAWRDLATVNEALRSADLRIKSDAKTLAQRAATIESLLASVAHDMKTPLATLQLILQRALDPDFESERTDAVRNAMTEVQYAAALLDNLEIAAQMRSDALHEDAPHCDLREIVENATLRFSVLGRHRNMTVDGAWPETEVKVAAGPVMMTRIVSNLAHNAVRHGRSGGHVALTLDVEGGRFALSVADDGPGFPAEVIETLAAAEGAAYGPDRIGGRGLGLHIVKALCARHGFSFTLGAHPDGGALAVVAGAVADA